MNSSNFDFNRILLRSSKTVTIAISRLHCSIIKFIVSKAVRKNLLTKQNSVNEAAKLQFALNIEHGQGQIMREVSS